MFDLIVYYLNALSGVGFIVLFFWAGMRFGAYHPNRRIKLLERLLDESNEESDRLLKELYEKKNA